MISVQEEGIQTKEEEKLKEVKEMKVERKPSITITSLIICFVVIVIDGFLSIKIIFFFLIIYF